MKELIVKVKDQNKVEMLIQMLSALNFVDSVNVLPTKTTARSDSSEDFFEMAGIWKDRDISIDSIRQQAWRERK